MWLSLFQPLPCAASTHYLAYMLFTSCLWLQYVVVLQVYAAAFFAIPLIRWIINQGRNRNIQQRNEARKDIATVLQRPDGKLRAKLQSAAKQAQRTVISDKDIVYSSNKDFTDQNLDLDGESFDKRLAELERQSDFDSKVDRGGQSSSKKKAFEW